VAAPQKTYEYRAIVIDDRGHLDESGFLRMLNEQGAEGWKRSEEQPKGGSKLVVLLEREVAHFPEAVDGEPIAQEWAVGSLNQTYRETIDEAAVRFLAVGMAVARLVKDDPTISACCAGALRELCAAFEKIDEVVGE
jgi:hypothetical protein